MRNALRVSVVGAVLLLAVALFITPPAAAQPKLIWGYLYDSDGDNVTQSTSITLVVVRDGSEAKHTASFDTATGIWQVTLDDWRQGDTYYVVVDGTPWGDADYRAHDPETPGRTQWTMNAAGAEQLDLQTFKEAPMNLKPLLAGVFALLLALVSLLLIGPMNRQHLDVAITGKKKVTVRRGDRVESFFSYTCSYGTPDDLTELGEIERSTMDVRDGTLQRVSVSRIVRTPDGSYDWNKPKLMEAAGVRKELASEDVVHGKWFQGGALQLSKGQTPASAAFRHKAWLWAGLGAPFILLELIFMIWSSWTGDFAVPPYLGLGLLIDVIILLVGIDLAVLALRHVKKPTGAEKAGAGEAAETSGVEASEDDEL